MGCPCCNLETTNEIEQKLTASIAAPWKMRLARWRRRGIRSGSWLLPAVTLALMPKCPICFATYATMLTGVGLSFTAASYLRLSLIVVSVLALGIVAATTAWRRFAAQRIAQR